MSTVAFYTLGCKVNQYETEAIAEGFKQNGFKIVDYEGPADVYVINTCSVTSMSDRKDRQIIRRAKKNNPASTVIVTGCYAQVAPDDVKAIDGVDIVVGNDNKMQIVNLAINKVRDKVLVNDISHGCAFESMSIDGYSERTRAFIKIQDGCNQFCSYCVIPYARGRIRSRVRDEILQEATRLAENGYFEIILAGIHMAAYGEDFKDKYDLADLICDLNRIEKIKRIRLSSIEPMTLNEEFVSKIKNADKLCPHFHLSLQSGCDETLKRMNRHYTTDEYKHIVDLLRENFKDAAITTDIMVGFAGETEEEFKETARFVKEIGFSEAHVFEYSRRKGTVADKLPNQVSPQVKKERSEIIIDITNKSRDEFRKKYIGKTVEVLFEQETKKGSGIYEGKTRNYIPVLVKSEEDLEDRFLEVEIKGYKDGYLV